MGWQSDSMNLATWYADPALLRERQGHYSAPAQGPRFVDWVLDLVDLSGVGWVLDAGAGVGRFTLLLARACRGRVVACDLFPGMIAAVRDSLGEADLPGGTLAADVTALPFADRAFERVFANHMLYHVPDLNRGIEELARVTASDGRCIATTNADDVPVPVIELHYAALDLLGIAREPAQPSLFSLRNGEDRLRHGFREVTRHVYRNQVTYATPEEFLDLYRTTGRFRSASGSGEVSAEELVGAAAQVCREWFDAEPGPLVSPLVMGAFIAARPRHGPATGR